MIKTRSVSDLRNKFPEIELKLDEADTQAKKTDVRHAHKDVFKRLKNRMGNHI